MKDKQSVEKLQELHPKVRPDFQNFIEEIEQQFDVTVRIIEAFRSWQKQADYYAIGRTVKGENASPSHPMGDVITNAPAGSGFHLYGLAADIAPLKNGEVDYTYDQGRWFNIAQQYNLEWGGSWQKIKDTDHWQETLGYTWEQLLELYRENKFIPGTNFLQL